MLEVYSQGTAAAGVFKVAGDPTELAVSSYLFRDGLELVLDHEWRYWFSHRLAGTLFERFLEHGFMVDLDESIDIYTDLHRSLLANPIHDKFLGNRRRPAFRGKQTVLCVGLDMFLTYFGML